jgi:hypothetical protein
MGLGVLKRQRGSGLPSWAAGLIRKSRRVLSPWMGFSPAVYLFERGRLGKEVQGKNQGGGKRIRWEPPAALHAGAFHIRARR